MAAKLPDITLSNLSAFLAKEIGLLFPRERWRDLEAGVVSAARQLGHRDVQDFISWLTSAPLTRHQIEELAGFLTVGETYFFRDPRTLEVLESEILPSVLRARRGKDRSLRIWSAGCSTGEEPYTLAILLHRLLPDIRHWKITILATDINAASLRKGIQGSYGTWSFRATPSWFKSNYFNAEADGSLRVVDHIRQMVSFEYLNLAEDSYPSLPTNTNAMDLIFCRNVLMYFCADMARTVIDKLQRSLAERGWLILGPAESAPRDLALLEAMSIGGVICYRKRGGEEESRARAAAAVEEGGTEVSPGAATQAAATHFRQAARPPLAPGEREPGEAVASYPAAAMLYRQGLYPQAAAMLQELHDRGELPAEAVTLLIRSQANRGKLPDALAVCEEALKERKLDPALHYLRAEILQEQGKGEQAQLSLQRALYLDPKQVLAHFALGNLTLWTGNADRACKHFSNALALLDHLDTETIVPGSEGMTAGRLREIIVSMTVCAERGEGRRA